MTVLAIPRGPQRIVCLTEEATEWLYLLGEQESIVGFRWWTADKLRATDDSVFPPDLGERFARLLVEGCPPTPIDIG